MFFLWSCRNLFEGSSQGSPVKGPKRPRFEKPTGGLSSHELFCPALLRSRRLYPEEGGQRRRLNSGSLKAIHELILLVVVPWETAGWVELKLWCIPKGSHSPQTAGCLKPRLLSTAGRPFTCWPPQAQACRLSLFFRAGYDYSVHMTSSGPSASREKSRSY